jgi:O-antigen chain-terminating methyltransferase
MDCTAAVSRPLAEDTPVQATPELEQCLNRVEYYQPLYGIRGFEPSLRDCRDRAVAIESALSPMGATRQTPCRLIDFGSSLGFFPFFFADRGAITTGFDINPANTAVAVATQKLNRLPATFQTAALSLSTVRTIRAGVYDVALVLSVLHHVAYKRGFDYAACVVADLLARIPTLILELAHRNEDVKFAWQNSLPENPLDILKDCPGASATLLGHFPSHLSASTRPMYLVCRATDRG